MFLSETKRQSYTVTPKPVLTHQTQCNRPFAASYSHALSPEGLIVLLLVKVIPIRSGQCKLRVLALFRWV